MLNTLSTNNSCYFSHCLIPLCCCLGAKAIYHKCMCKLLVMHVTVHAVCPYSNVITLHGLFADSLPDCVKSALVEELLSSRRQDKAQNAMPQLGMCDVPGLVMLSIHAMHWSCSCSPCVQRSLPRSYHLSCMTARLAIYQHHGFGQSCKAFVTAGRTHHWQGMFI